MLFLKFQLHVQLHYKAIRKKKYMYVLVMMTSGTQFQKRQYQDNLLMIVMYLSGIKSYVTV